MGIAGRSGRVLLVLEWPRQAHREIERGGDHCDEGEGEGETAGKEATLLHPRR